MKLAINAFFPVLLSLCLGGCVSVQKYPEQWAQGIPEHDLLFDKPGGKCDLTGSYADAGEPAPGQNGSVPISLFDVLFPGSQLSAATTPERVALNGPEGGELKVVAWKDGKPVETKQLKSFACLEDGLVMVNPGAKKWDDNYIVTFGAGNQDNFLYRGRDGWLILKRINLTVVVPWFKWETVWYRFRPVNPAEGAQ